MNNPQLIMDRLEYYLADPDRGVLGLVDCFLAAARVQDIRLEWQAGSFSAVFLQGGNSRRMQVPLPKSVFRAALVRLAALCNERCPGSVSPYGGEGEIAIDDDSSKVIRVIFANTGETVSVELAVVSPIAVSSVLASHEHPSN
jgi:hypothetical protein